MILDPNGMPILQPTIDNAETATFNDAFAAVGNAVAAWVDTLTVATTPVTSPAGYTTSGSDVFKVGTVVTAVVMSRIDSGDIPSATMVGTVAPGFRPAALTVGTCAYANGSAGQATLATNGEVTVYINGTSARKVALIFTYRTP